MFIMRSKITPQIHTQTHTERHARRHTDRQTHPINYLEDLKFTSDRSTLVWQE